MDEKELPKYFQCPKSKSDKWKEIAFDEVSRWMIDEINRFGIGAPQTIKEFAIDSREIGEILPDRNNQPVRYLLGQLYKKGYIDIIDNLTFCLKKRIDLK